MKFIMIVCVIGAAFILVESRVDRAYRDGIKDGTKAALRTNPVSEELEMTCAGLWIGEQNKKQVLNSR